ncbi:MAG: ExbD/TolR family protein [Vicinamibacterales bacterium]
MSMSVGGEEGAVKSEINVTPLVDVMLVLLIIMMIVAPMLQKGVPVKLPVATNSSDKPETQDQTVLGVTADRSVYVDSVMVPMSDLRRKLEEALEEKSVKLLYIKADEDAPYGAVMEAMDEARAAGIEDMGLITEKKNTGEGK